MANFTVEGTKTKKLYVNKDGTKRLIRKLKVVKDNTTTVPYALPEVTYTSSYNPSFTTKDVLMSDTYGAMPTFSTTTKGVDFWFYPNQVAADGSTKYADNPWAAYADANSDLKSSYGYRRDQLAEHWNKKGSGEGRLLGGVTSSTICEREDSHELQHISARKQVPFKFTQTARSLGSAIDTDIAAQLYYQSGAGFADLSIVRLGTAKLTSESVSVYPGVKIIIHSRSKGIGSDPWIKVNGTKVASEGNYSYTVTDRTESITVSNKPVTRAGEWWQVTVTIKESST